MRIHEIKDDAGRTFAFEVDNAFLRRRGVVKIVRQLPGAVILKSPKLFSWLAEDVFCEFDMGGQCFQIWEPFGDSSRYWVGPKDSRWYADIDLILEAFRILPHKLASH